MRLPAVPMVLHWELQPVPLEAVQQLSVVMLLLPEAVRQLSVILPAPVVVTVWRWGHLLRRAGLMIFL